MRRRGSKAETEGIRVTVVTEYLDDLSNAAIDQFVFAYFVEIANHGDASAQLISRHWIVTNAAGEVSEVRGDGVVGEQPRLQPGECFKYSSFCPLETEFGTMGGSFEMQRRDGTRFEAQVGTFVLARPQAIN